MNSMALPGEVPQLPDFASAGPSAAAVDMAARYAYNVHPGAAPDAATRGQAAAFQATLSGAQTAFLGPCAALLALPSGRVVLLSLKARCCSLAARVYTSFRRRQPAMALEV